ncbi:FAL1 [Hepatospora eriocheir]|uniref:FAL1 n=1 Tax=Hepatospora eriocheir TaxID=1081669 RepID=A0A1X0QFK5_9MICR|nr:FAL1 [Hepatospora eriocheir]
MCKNAQKVFFSATYNEKTQNIIKKLCNDQVECNFTTNKLANNLKLYYVEVPRNITKKLELLNTLFKTLQLSALIVFCNSKKIVESVFSNLKNEGFPVSMIHGDATKDERDLVFNEFKKGSTKFLITTDLFSRGIDIPHVNLVINFDLPTDQFGTSEDIYNHRVGRTGRFNRPGFIIDFITGKEDLDRLIKIQTTQNKLSKMFTIDDLVNVMAEE